MFNEVPNVIFCIVLEYFEASGTCMILSKFKFAVVLSWVNTAGLEAYFALPSRCNTLTLDIKSAVSLPTSVKGFPLAIDLADKSVFKLIPKLLSLSRPLVISHKIPKSSDLDTRISIIERLISICLWGLSNSLIKYL